MAVSEGLVFGGVDLNDGVNYTLRGIGFPVPKKRQEWVQGADADGSALVRDPLFENRQVPARVRVNPQGTLTMDQALAKYGQLVDLIEEAEKQPDGTALIWTPAQGTKSLTLYALSGEITDTPIEKATQNSGWFLKAPMVGFTLDCKPFGYGQAVDTVSDAFSSDSIGAGSYTFDAGGGTLSVNSGQLVPSSTAEKRLYRSKEGLSYCDSQVTVAVTTGASVASGSTQLVECRIDANNYLRAGVNFAGAASTLTIEKVVAGAATQLGPASGAFTTVAATTYWVRLRAEKNLLTVELWTSQPSATGAAAQSLTYILAGSDATTFGQGVVGQSGLRLIPQATDYRWDDFQIEPNLWRSSAPIVTGLVPAIPGDATAEGRLVITDAAGQSRRHVEFGLEQRYYSAGAPRILDQFAADTIGSGAWAFDAGSGTISIAGGLLVPSDAAEKRLYRSDSGGSYTDVQATVKVTTGASVASGSTKLVLARTDANNYLRLGLDFTGAGSTLSIGKVVAGSATTLGVTSGFATAAATSYWVRATRQGLTLTTSLYTADPATGAAATQTLAYTMTPAEALLFASGQAGLRLLPQAADYRWDDFRVDPLAGATDLLLDSEALILTGYAGTSTTRAGAYTGGTVANQVVRAALGLQSAAVCGLGNLGHVGAYRVKARVYASNAAPTSAFLRLSWQDGDGSWRANDWVNPSVGAGFCEVDLGVVSISPASLGMQKWSGRIEAYTGTSSALPGTDTLDVDYVEVIPAGEVYGKGRGPYAYSPGATSGRDEFTSITAGTALNARTAPSGGSWATSGAATDLAAADAPLLITDETESRATASDAAGGRYAILGATAFTDVEVGVSVYATLLITGTGTAVNMGAIARWTDASNHVRVYLRPDTSSGSPGLYVAKVVAGVSTQLGFASFQPNSGAWYALRVVIFASGAGVAYVLDSNGNVIKSVAFADAALATGGTLATGKPGFQDVNTVSGPGPTRYYDNFYVATPAAEQIVVYPGRLAEFRYDSALRQDSGGTFYGQVPSYRGSRVILPVAGSPGRTARVVAKARRNDLDSAVDDQIADPTWLQLKYTPRYIAIPR